MAEIKPSDGEKAKKIEDWIEATEKKLDDALLAAAGK